MSCAIEKDVLLNVIDIYKDMPYLWRGEHKDYSKKEERSEGFKVLLQTYGNVDEKATVKILKRKLDYMRTTYMKELKKVR
ncbi:unnamed protein product [Parnassius apollo]|uniref:(apollo) hypothetical protein n=1 Tax=Parnassius apollo TaxID=110799 RepID=A0A8S3WSF7_PARAO|nr:unnamed protein product [Parnassius apollo]